MRENKAVANGAYCVSCCVATHWGRWASRPNLYYATLGRAIERRPSRPTARRGEGGVRRISGGRGGVYGQGVDNFQQKGR